VNAQASPFVQVAVQAVCCRYRYIAPCTAVARVSLLRGTLALSIAAERCCCRARLLFHTLSAVHDLVPFPSDVHCSVRVADRMRSAHTHLSCCDRQMLGLRHGAAAAFPGLHAGAER